MKRLLNRFTLFFEQLPAHLRRKRRFVWGGFILLTIIVGSGISFLKVDMTMDSWFSDDDPAKISIDQFREEFGGTDSLYIVYEPKNGDVFHEDSLKAIAEIREEILSFRTRLKKGETSPLEHITRVDTIVSANLLDVQKDSLISRKFVGNNFPTNAEERERLRNEAMQQSNFPRTYFSENSKYGGIVIGTDFGAIPEDSPTEEFSKEDGLATGEEEFVEGEEEFVEEEEFSDGETMEMGDMEIDETVVIERTKFKTTEMEEYVAFMDSIYEIIHQEKYTRHLNYYPVGMPALMHFFMELLGEFGYIYLAMFSVIFLFLILLFRSFSGVVWPLCIILFTTIWSFGLMGWLGMPITSMISLIVMLILAVGIADSVHILSGYSYFRREGKDHENALRLTMKKSGLACLLTSLTTMVGMFSLMATPIGHIQAFGVASAFGVGFAFLLTVFILPLLLDLWAPAPKTTGESSPFLQRLLDQTLFFVEKNPILVVSTFTITLGVCLYGATMIKIDSNMVEEFEKGSPVQTAYKLVDQFMMGTQNMEVYIQMHEEDALQDPKVLKTIESMQNDLEKNYPEMVVQTTSLADIVKDAYKVLNEGRAEMEIIPDDPRVLSQSLFLFNNANPTDRRQSVSDDYSKTHISVLLKNAGSYDYVRFFEKAQKDLDEKFAHLKTSYPKMEVKITGGLALVMELSDYISWSQVKSLGIALFVISVLLIFLFGSLRIGLFSILPNIIPTMLPFGILGLMGIPLDANILLIAPVIIGIAVDDTIHFITHYRAEVLHTGDIRKALSITIREVGQAITFTSLILGFGFLILGFSSHTGMSRSGIIGGTSIFLALFADLFLLPALILLFKAKFQGKKTSLKTSQAA